MELSCSNLKAGAIPVGAALCRERAAKQPQQFQLLRINPGAALRPFRDTRPLPQVLRQPREQCCTCGRLPSPLGCAVA
ncbi:protein of unknown function [Pseudomonas sp. JV551A1]|uniref:Uncharacterized protein n=1 Tax=Pseudomonas inefficax TaxID=2078786 RepID=A0AAQ1P9G8_9PSED|nr:protein of unknown function [Pseudomonas sp. JV551A1]SPO61123.1 protein of unknown function [Pseudomonas inefficax]